MKDIVIIGAGDCGRELAGFIEDMNKTAPQYNILGFLDKKEKVGSSCGKYEVIGEDSDLMTLFKEKGVCAVIAMQEGEVRKKIAESLSEFTNWETIVHPSATIMDSVSLGKGTIISPNVCISIDTTVGGHCFFSIGASIGHDCEIADYASFMPGSVLCGHVTLGERSYIATNASVMPGVKIGQNVVLGAGSVALEEIPDNVMVYGNPGRVIMKRRSK